MRGDGRAVMREGGSVAVRETCWAERYHIAAGVPSATSFGRFFQSLVVRGVSLRSAAMYFSFGCDYVSGGAYLADICL